MSPVLPPGPSLQAVPPARPADARAAFFRQAMGQAPDPPPVASPEPAAASAPSPTERLPRPGSLLDIRV